MDETPASELPEMRCPRTRLVWSSLTTGEVIRARCRANFCWYCAPRNAVLIARAQARSQPERAIRFSKLPTDWQRIRSQMEQVREALRDAGMTVEMAWTVEPNPSGINMAHAHALQHGDYLPQGFLQEVCERNGLGIPFIEQVRDGQQATTYGLKTAGAALYGLKGASGDDETLNGFLGLNGGRLSHHTRGFYRVEGERVTQGQAIEALKTLGLEDEDGPWVLHNEGESPASARRGRLRAAGTRTGKAQR